MNSAIKKAVIADVFKTRRRELGMSASEVVDKLSEYGTEISPKTLYGYENGVAYPKAETFLSLCAVYGIRNVEETFLLEKEGASSAARLYLSAEERDIIRAYRCSTHQNAVKKLLGISAPAVGNEQVRPKILELEKLLRDRRNT